jgi:glycosyltransferase involved in cell wall biosynthesis
MTVHSEVSVIVPTPWIPPGMPVASLRRFRAVPEFERDAGVDVYCPRVLGSVEYYTQQFDSTLAARRVIGLARRLHAARPFDLIHAHFIYPDGVLASRIGKELRIPVLTTEHAFWLPWLKDQPRVAAKVESALPSISLVTCVSEFLRQSVDAYLRGRVPTEVLANVVDTGNFRVERQDRDPNEILYVGLVRRFKRIDVLLRAMAIAVRSLPSLKLRILSANAFRAYQKDRNEMFRLIETLGLSNRVTVVNGATPVEVGEAMRRCAFVAVSSERRETFCAVAAESLACGTPLIITRCGGPEEFVSRADGVMVPADDPEAFAAGIEQAFLRRAEFVPEEISARIIGRFGQQAWGGKTLELYRRIVAVRELPSAK